MSIYVRLKSGAKGIVGDGDPTYALGERGYWDSGKWMNGDVIFWATRPTKVDGEIFDAPIAEEDVEIIRDLLPSARWIGIGRIAVGEKDYMLLLLAAEDIAAGRFV